MRCVEWIEQLFNSELTKLLPKKTKKKNKLSVDKNSINSLKVVTLYDFYTVSAIVKTVHHSFVFIRVKIQYGIQPDYDLLANRGKTQINV